MVCWQVGEKPESVTVVGSAMEDMFKELGIMDTVSITLKFPSGALGIIDQSRHAPYGADQRLEVSHNEMAIPFLKPVDYFFNFWKSHVFILPIF